MDAAILAQMTAEVIEFGMAAPDLIDAALDEVISVDWCDLGEVTVVTTGGTFRATFIKLDDE
jgi:hypothetical protein